jgi:hypothetical protein
MNIEAEALTGYRSAELVNIGSLLLLHDTGEIEERASQIHAEHGVRLEGFDVIAGPPEGWRHEAAGAGESIREEPWTFIRRDGTRVQVNLAVKVLRGADGRRTGMIGIASDTAARALALKSASLVTNHDTLTGLIGYNLLEDRISQSIKRSRRSGSKVAVLLLRRRPPAGEGPQRGHGRPRRRRRVHRRRLRPDEGLRHRVLRGALPARHLGAL